MGSIPQSNSKEETMNVTFLIYLLLFLPLLLFFLWVTKERVLKDEPIFVEYALGLVVVLIVIGDIAIATQQWFWTRSSTIGFYVGNHPVEAILQAFMTPLFIVSVWEFVKHRK